MESKFESETTKDTLRKKQYQREQVIVHIWTSAGNPNHPGRNVGHISIRTPKQYGSIAPEDEDPTLLKILKSIIRPIPHQLMPNYKADYENEYKRDPELTFCFYSLNVLEIYKRFEQLEKNLKGWSLAGNVRENAESCASLAWALLEAGGISKLTGKIDQSFVSSQGSAQGSFLSSTKSFISLFYATSSQVNESKKALGQAAGASLYSTELGLNLVIKSPDALGEILKIAKRNEVRNEPLTQGLGIPSAWQPETRRPRCKQCIIS